MHTIINNRALMQLRIIIYAQFNNRLKKINVKLDKGNIQT